MKGHLSAGQLKSMKREELQALAKDLGVRAGGKTEEIIARITAVEVGVTEEDQLTGEEKAVAEAAWQEEERVETEQEAREQAAAAEERAATGQRTAEGAGSVKVRAVTRFLDKRLDQIKDAGEVYSVSRERAAELVAAGVAEIMG